MKKKLTLIFTLLTISFSFAQTFNANGINYSVISSTTNVKVSSNGSFVGAANIPSTVTDGTTTFTVTGIDSFAFYNCAGLTSVSLPSSITTIDTRAFSDCANLNSINIPTSVTTLGSQVFVNCTSLTTVSIPDSVTSIGAAIFANCTNLTSVSIGNSITTIPQGMFSGCSHLTSVTIPNSVTSIANVAFNACTSLTSLSLPNSITSIGNNAFGSCSNLTSFTLPASITFIDEYAFAFCNQLTSFTANLNTPLTINANVFAGVTQSNCTLYVPSGSVVAYQAAPVWQNFAPINPILSNSNFSIENNLSFYPNPIQNDLYVDLENVTQATLQIIDTNGRVIQNKELQLNNKINTSNLPLGMYFFKISSNEGVAMRRIVKI